MPYLSTFIVSLVLTMILVPPLIRLAPVIGALDIPDARKVHSKAIPRIGGIAMIIGALVPILFWVPIALNTTAIVLAFLIILVFGLWDDRANLDYRIKFFGQILAVLVAVFFGDVVVRDVPFINAELPEYIAIPFTIFALVGITNAINLSDGLDGLAGGTMLLTFSMMALLGFKAEGFTLVILCLAISGSILGFLRHNTYPAQIFMGDTGSQFLGFSAGVAVILLTQNTNGALSPMLPLLLLGLPILDTVAVMSTRIYEGRSPFSPDKNHIHHKLLAVGLDHYEAVFIIYLAQTLLVSSAYFLRYESDLLIFALYMAFSLTVLGFLHWAKTHNWKAHAGSVSQSRFRFWIGYIHDHGLLEKYAILFLKVSVPLFFISTALIPTVIREDIGVMALAMLVLLVLSMFSSKNITILEKMVAYITCVISVYLLELNIQSISEYSNAINIYIVLMAVAFAIKVRFSKDRSFQVTPMDFLVVLLVLVVPNLPEFSGIGIPLGDAAFKLVVLFYACESLLNIRPVKWDLFRLGVTLMLAIVAQRALL